MEWGKIAQWLDSLFVALRSALRKPQTAPETPVEPASPAPLPANPPSMPLPSPTVPESDVLDWTTPKGAFHAARVTADNVGLTVAQKDTLCACLYQESQFLNTAINKNRNSAGTVLSTDWGLAQVNDHYHIGPGKDFPSVQYVLANPEKVVAWMAGILKETGKLQPWVSYTSGAYLHWLSPSSPMWALRS